MEILTPENLAGHNPRYLEGIANIILLDKLEIDPHDTIPEEGVSISYIDYEIVKQSEEEEGIPDPSPFGSFGAMKEGDEMATISLKMFTKKIEKQSHNIKCEPTLDPSIQIQKHISSEVYQELLRLSAINKESISDHFPTGLDLQLSGDKSPDKRKVISRILMCANMIASKGRRGPATFVILGKEYIDYLRHDVQDDVDFMSIDSLNMFSAGLNIYVSGKLGNTVLVGRLPKDATEPGVHLVTTTKDISGKINVTNNDISDVDVSYMIAITGQFPERSYLQFNILDHVNE